MDRFHAFGLKRLVATGFKKDGKGVWAEYDGVKTECGELAGNGDFRSEECEAFLREADVVVTNPPFSLFREYVAQLMEFGKKFLIIGNMNAVTYKEIFPLIKENKLWLGCSIHSGGIEFRVPDDTVLKGNNWRIDENGVKYLRLGWVRWFTNVPHTQKHTPLTLYKKYRAEDYPKYDNYDAIEVSKTADIPMDYDGVMGVPISFLDKYCPEQFEILNANDYRKSASVPVKPHGLVKDKDSYITERERSMPEYSYGSYEDMVSRPIVDGKKTYRRMFVKRITCTWG